LCEVEFSLAQSGHDIKHKVRAALTPEGNRAFTIDGKSKSGAQIKVQAFVNSLWLMLNTNDCMVG